MDSRKEAKLLGTALMAAYLVLSVATVLFVAALFGKNITNHVGPIETLHVVPAPVLTPVHKPHNTDRSQPQVIDAASIPGTSSHVVVSKTPTQTKTPKAHHVKHVKHVKPVKPSKEQSPLIDVAVARGITISVSDIAKVTLK